MRNQVSHNTTPSPKGREPSREQRVCSRARGLRKGFTLIELLVVIAILGILLSILIPSVGKGLEMAKSVQCMSNIRQAHGFAWEYATDHESLLPYSNSNAPGRPNCFFFMHLKYEDPGASTLVCPSAKYHGENPWGGPMRSIGANTMVMPYNYQSDDPARSQGRVHLDQIKRPSDVIMLGDSAQFADFRVLPYINNWWIRNSSFNIANAELPLDSTFVAQTGFWDDIPLIPLRHAGKANLINVDGSARRISHLSQLEQRNLTINY